MDHFDAETRSAIMRRVRSMDTSPELRVRHALHRLGYRYRLHHPSLPGRPDLVFPARHKVIFIHGCFWHGHPCKRGDRLPATNQDYWREKIDRNRKRDRRHQRQLRCDGWSVAIVWECQLKEFDRMTRRLCRFLGPPGSASSTED